MLVLLIGAIIGGLALKYWEPIKELVLEIKDKIMGIYNTIKEWFVSLWTWGLEAGTDEEGKWSVTTFITNIWDTIKKWFESLWTWASGGIAAGWTTVTNYIKGIWDTVYGWFTGLWSWASDGIAKGWTNLTTYIKGIWDTVYGWFTGLWSWASDGIAAGWTNLTTYIKGIWDTVYGWFTGLWSWASGGIAEGWTNLTDYITKIWTGVKAWFSKIFSWGEDDEKAGEGWSLSTLISGIFTGLKNWFFGLFGIDPKKGELSAEDFAKISEGFSLTNLLMKAVRGIGDFFWKGDGTGLLEFDLSGVKEKMLNVGKVLGIVGKATKAALKAIPKALIGGETPLAAFKRVMKSGTNNGGVMTSDGLGITTGPPTTSSATNENPKELKKLLKDKEQLEYSLENSSINAMDTSKRYWVTQDQWDSNQLQLQQLNEKIKTLGGNPYGAENAATLKSGDEWKAHKNKYGLTDDDFSSWRREKMRDHRSLDPVVVTAPKPTMQDAAISLSSAGPKNARGMGNTSVVDASTSNSSTSNNSNTNVTVVNKLPVTASDPYTTKQYRRFRGMRGGGS